MVQLKLGFVNKGKPFTLPNWSVRKHKKALELLNKADIKDDEKDLYFQFYLIYVGLKVIDPNVNFETIKNLHPKVITDLFDAIYNSGKFDIFFRPKKQRSKN